MEVKCPECNRVMINVSYRWEPVSQYMCPVHSYCEPIGETKGIHMHISDKVFDIDPRQVFKSLKD